MKLIDFTFCNFLNFNTRVIMCSGVKIKKFADKVKLISSEFDFLKIHL